MPNTIKSPKYQNKHGIFNKALRLLWSFTWMIFFRPTPKWCMNSWRVFLLRCFGARIGTGSRVFPTVKVWAPWNLSMGVRSVLGDNVDCYSVAKISIGDAVTVSQRAFLCTATHDFSSLKMELKSSDIVIENYSWVCAEAFIGPGVQVGEGCVVGARTKLTKRISSWQVCTSESKLKLRPRLIRERV